MANIPTEAINAVESSGMFEKVLNADPEGPERTVYRSAPPSPTTSEELNLDDWNGSGDDDYVSKVGHFRTNKSKKEVERPPVYVPPHSGARTGIKGVIADAKASKDGALQNAQSNMARSRAAYSSAGTLGKTYQEEEDEFQAIEAYREGRMRQISGRPTFRKVREVTANELHELLESDADVYRIVHVYLKDHAPCIEISKHIRVLAVAFPHTQFLNAEANDIGFTSGGPDVLPTLLIYFAGELTSTIIRAQDESQGTLDGLAQVLIGHGALKDLTGSSQMENSESRRNDSGESSECSSEEY